MSSSLSSWSTAPMGAGRLLQDARWGVAGFLPAARGCKILILATGAPLRARSQRPTSRSQRPTFLRARSCGRGIGARGNATALVRQGVAHP